MNFAWALEQMLAGKKVTRASWSAVLTVNDGFLTVNDGCFMDELGHPSLLAGDAILATDWELFDDRPPMDGTFASALAAMQAGYKVRRRGWVRTEAWYHKADVILSTDGWGTNGMANLTATDWEYDDRWTGPEVQDA